MTLTDETLQSLRNSLVAGIDGHNRRRRSRRRIAVGVPVLAMAVTAGLTLSNGEDNSAFALTKAPDGSIRVEVYPSFDEVDGLEDALTDAGLEVDIIHLRSHPALDGVIEVSSHNNENSGALEFDNGEFVIDAGAVEGPIEILIYSTAEEGRTYQAAPSVFAPGQELGGLPCAYPDSPLSTADLERRAREVGIDDIVWVLFDEPGPGATASEPERRPDGVVAGAQMRNATTLSVTVYPKFGLPAAESLSLSSGAHFRDVPTCTPELAARWN